MELFNLSNFVTIFKLEHWDDKIFKMYKSTHNYNYLLIQLIHAYAQNETTEK